MREREGIENRGREKRKETVKERRSGVERERESIENRGRERKE